MTIVAASADAAALARPVSAAAQPTAAPFPTGKPVSIHVGATPGGGNDHIMRMVARHIGKHLPGQPTWWRRIRRAPADGGSRA